MKIHSQCRQNYHRPNCIKNEMQTSVLQLKLPSLNNFARHVLLSLWIGSKVLPRGRGSEEIPHMKSRRLSKGCNLSCWTDTTNRMDKSPHETLVREQAEADSCPSGIQYKALSSAGDVIWKSASLEQSHLNCCMVLQLHNLIVVMFHPKVSVLGGSVHLKFVIH